jgi:hypothetical protein
MNLDPDTEPIPPPDEDDEDDEEPSAAAAAGARRGGTAQGSILAAAMLAVGDILEPEKTVIEIEQANDDPVDDPPFELDFGDLPPLT